MTASRGVRLKTRLFVEDDLGPGARVALAGKRVHYLLNVLRMRSGASLGLFNGRDGEWRAELVEAARGRAALAVRAQARAQAAGPDLWLLVAPVKRAPIDLIAAKATELGVAAVRPVWTARTAVRRVNLARMRANAVEAAEQSARLTVPEVLEAAPLADVLADWSAGRRLVVLDESGGGVPIAQALGRIAPGPAAVLAGPEGGFARSELDALRNLPFVTAVGMGPRILRTETAALAALACWQALVGDWRDEPPVPTARTEAS